MSSKTDIRVLIADDHGIFRNGLKNIFESYLSEDHITIAGEASNGKEAIHQVDELGPDIVLMDIQMPDMDGIEATSVITKNYPATKVIALSTFTDPHVVLKMFSAGAKGFLMKKTDVNELKLAITSVFNGETYITSEVSSQLIHNIHLDRSEGPGKFLNDREIQIIQFICEGLSNKEIAEQLRLSKRTIDAYREKIMEKTGATNAFDLFTYAVHYGIHKMKPLTANFHIKLN